MGGWCCGRIRNRSSSAIGGRPGPPGGQGIGVSLVAWLDVSAEEQRRVRELVKMFSDKDTLDELGIGQVRDTFSDALFPGISTIQTRARYFLLVPWAYRLAAARRSGRDIAAKAKDYERTTIGALRRSDAGQGIIGARAGQSVRTLASSIYWGGLVTFGILSRPVAADQLRGDRASVDGNDELASRTRTEWSPTIPPAPAGFPDEIPGGFALSGDEAQWLSERVLTAVPSSYLADLVRSRVRPLQGSYAAWADPAAEVARGDNRRLLYDAERFSLAIQGASMLYQLLVREQYGAAGFDRVTTPIADFRANLTTWEEQVASRRAEIADWDRARMWTEVKAHSPGLSMATRAFVEAWIDVIARGEAIDIADQPRLRRLIESREWQIKRGQARLRNVKTLAQWGGGAGTARLNYRWGNVRILLTDITDGLAHVGT